MTKVKIQQFKVKYKRFTTSYKLIAEFDSISEASRITGINKGNISSCCNEKRQSAGGYFWKKSNRFKIGYWYKVKENIPVITKKFKNKWLQCIKIKNINHSDDIILLENNNKWYFIN